MNMERVLNSKLGRAITRVVEKPGSLGFRLTRDTVGVMVKRFGITSVKGQKEAMIMNTGLAEMHVQRPVLGLVTRLGWPLRSGSRNIKKGDLMWHADFITTAAQAYVGHRKICSVVFFGERHCWSASAS